MRYFKSHAGLPVHEYLTRAQGAGLSWPLPEGLADDAIKRMPFPALSDVN